MGCSEIALYAHAPFLSVVYYTEPQFADPNFTKLPAFVTGLFLFVLLNLPSLYGPSSSRTDILDGRQ